MTQPREGIDFKAVLREYLESLVIAVLLAIIIRAFVVAAYKVPTTSMLPTLRVGDFIFAYKVPYGMDVPLVGSKWFAGHLPERGEVVVFKHPKDKSVTYVKRVVGLPGDKIQILASELFINDTKVSRELLPHESFSNLPGYEDYFFYEETIAPYHYTVMVAKANTVDSFGPVIIPPDQVFVLGDNRFASDDSRYWGTIPVENVEGRVFLIWLSLDWSQKIGGFPSVRWDRVLQTL